MICDKKYGKEVGFFIYLLLNFTKFLRVLLLFVF